VKFLVLDISSKTGWAHFESGPEGLKLLGRGQMAQVPRRTDLKYPEDYLKWAEDVSAQIRALVWSRSHDYLVIEETAKGSKDAHAQKLLEWIHLRVAEHIVAQRRVGNLAGAYYLQTGEWRQTAGCQMTKEEKKRNSKVRKSRKAAGNSALVELDGKKVGLVSKKHVTLRRVKEIFDIDLPVKQNDEADALLIGYAAYKRFFEGRD
jgi:hypothetical protein